MQEVNKNRILWLAYLAAALAVSLLKLSVGGIMFGYTAYENYIIFKNSFFHLIDGQNPYNIYIVEQWDLYKYSPAFALAMAPFAVLPDWLGLQLWNLLNAWPLLWAILNLPVLTPEKRRFLAWFILPELVISMQNSQSNGLTAAFLLLAFVHLEKQKPIPSAGWTAAGAFLKIFGIFAAAPAMAYPQRWKYVSGLAVFLVILALIPLVALSPSQLWQVYRWWGALLLEDHDASVGLSVLGWLQTWFGWAAPKSAITAIGLFLLGASTLAVCRNPDPVSRGLLWASVLIWVVIFNHKAESPTFVIALSGVGLWYLLKESPARWEKVILWTAFALASLSPTDVFPRALREHIVQPYVLKAVPCILIWGIITWKLLFNFGRVQPSPSTRTP